MNNYWPVKEAYACCGEFRTRIWVFIKFTRDLTIAQNRTKDKHPLIDLERRLRLTRVKSAAIVMVAGDLERCRHGRRFNSTIDIVRVANN